MHCTFSTQCSERYISNHLTEVNGLYGVVQIYIYHLLPLPRGCVGSKWLSSLLFFDWAHVRFIMGVSVGGKFYIYIFINVVLFSAFSFYLNTEGCEAYLLVYIFIVLFFWCICFFAFYFNTVSGQEANREREKGTGSGNVSKPGLKLGTPEAQRCCTII